MVFSKRKTKFFFIYILLIAFFILGASFEYKLGIIKDIQFNRNAKIWFKPLPEFPSKFNQKAGIRSKSSEKYPLNSNDRNIWQANIRERVQAELKGELFPKHSIQFKVLSTKDTPNLIEQEILVTGFDGQLIPARVFLPVLQKNLLPSILLIPGHSGSQSGMLQLSDEINSYQHAAARRLAESGFITFVFELRGFGYLGMPDYPEHNVWAFNALTKGDSYKGLILKDTAYLISLIKNYPNVDRDRIGISGVSYGGEVAVQYAALDTSIKAISFHSYAGNRGVQNDLNNSSELPHLCHLLPGIDDWMPQENWIWLLAPRYVHGIRGINERNNFLINEKLYAKAWPDKSKIKLEVLNGGHEYFVDSSITFFKLAL